MRIPLIEGLISHDISPQTCDHFEVTATNIPLQFLYPYYSLGSTEPTGYKLITRLADSKKQSKWLPGSKKSLFGLQHATPNTTIYLCEGETDALAVYQWLTIHNHQDYTVLALGGAPFESEWVDWSKQINTLRGEKDCILCFDNDQKGSEYYLAADTHINGGKKLPRIHLPEEFKDIAEYLKVGGSVKREAYCPPHSLLWGDMLTTGEVVAIDYVTTGYRSLDSIIGGWTPGGIVMLTGHTKNGKTAFASQLANNFIKTTGKRVLYIPLELNWQETLLVLICNSLGCTVEEAIRGDISTSHLCDERERLKDKLVMAKAFGFLDTEVLESWLDAIPHMNVGLVVLDHITAAATSYKEGLTTHALDAKLSLLQAKLNEYSVPGLVLCHTNNGGDRSNETITRDKLRGSLIQAQIAQVVLAIQRQEEDKCQVYTVIPDRFTGNNGIAYFRFNGSYTEVETRRKL